VLTSEVELATDEDAVETSVLLLGSTTDVVDVGTTDEVSISVEEIADKLEVSEETAVLETSNVVESTEELMDSLLDKDGSALELVDIPASVEDWDRVETRELSEEVIVEDKSEVDWVGKADEESVATAELERLVEMLVSGVEELVDEPISELEVTGEAVDKDETERDDDSKLELELIGVKLAWDESERLEEKLDSETVGVKVKDENSASDVVIEALLLMTGKELDRLEKSEAEVDDETRSELDVVSEDEIVALE
jgi:hypothetical protein